MAAAEKAPAVVCVLGTSRTGSSLTTRLLSLAGVYLGPEEELLQKDLHQLAGEGEAVLARAREANPEGFFEHYRMTRLNERILRAMGGNWREPPALPEGWEESEALAAEREDARALLDRSFAGRSLWGWKDPRNSLTLPFWQSLIPDLRYVICLRNPIDVASSLRKRDRISLEQGLDLWLAYVAGALINTSGQPRIARLPTRPTSRTSTTPPRASLASSTARGRSTAPWRMPCRRRSTNASGATAPRWGTSSATAACRATSSPCICSPSCSPPRPRMAKAGRPTCRRPSTGTRGSCSIAGRSRRRSDPMATGATAQRKPRGADLLAAEIRRRLGPVPALADPPLVSIVVLNRNGTEYLPGLLTGLSDRTEYPAFELIVVDNGSSDGSLDLLCAAEVPFPLSILANPHNETFSDGCNQGAGEASGQLLLFLNNDTEAFEPGWLTELVACLRGSGAGAVAATLLCRDEEHRADFRYGYGVAHRGLVFREEGETIHPVLDGWEADPLDERLGEDAERRAVAAACLLVDRAAFERVGGFTHGYVYGAEDVDLCLKLRAAGFRLLCSGRAIAIHHPVSTRRTKPFEEQRALKLANRRLLWERWGPRLQGDPRPDR